ncbi:MAG: YceI family protein [Maribacter sp.]
MKNVLKTTTLCLFILLGLSCNTSKKEKKEADAKDAKIVMDGPYHSVDTTGASLKWTAYKFTDKVGVHGTFDDFKLDMEKVSESREDFLEGDKITIHTQSVNSGNVIRDDKLRTYFFTVFHTDTIKAEILNANNGVGKMSLELNNITREIDYDYVQNGDTLFLNAAIDLIHWKGEEALNILNQECYELHMGADRVSKLWPNVDITMKLPMDLIKVSK